MPLSILVAVAGAARGRLERPPPVILVLDLVEYREDPAGDREVRRLLERSVNPA